MENSSFNKIRCLGGPESSKSAILDGKQLFVKNQVFRRARELKISYFRWKTAVVIKSVVQEVHRAQNRLFQIENSYLYQIRCLGGPESSKSAILDGKQPFISNQVFRRSIELKIGFFRWKTAVIIQSGVQEVQRAQNRLFQIENSRLYQIRFLGGPEIKIGYFRGKTAVFIKSGVQEVHRVQNWLFQMVNSCLSQIRCLGSPQSPKLAILDGKQLFISNQVFRRSIELKIGYFRWKTAVGIKSGI